MEETHRVGKGAVRRWWVRDRRGAHHPVADEGEARREIAANPDAAGVAMYQDVMYGPLVAAGHVAMTRSASGKILVHAPGDLVMVVAEGGQARAYQVQSDGSVSELEHDAMTRALREGAKFTAAGPATAGG